MNKKILLLLPFSISLSANTTDKPNVLFIYADDLGKGMLSAYGQKQFTTPNIDYLVKNGASFDNAYGCMLSAPARASLLTGYHDCHKNSKWTINTGGKYLRIKNERDLKRIENKIDRKDYTLPSGDLYLPEVFKKANYVTAQIGKLEYGFTATRKQMKRHGWDYYYGYLDHVRCHGFYPPFLFDNGNLDFIEGNNRIDCGKSIENETEETYKYRWNMEGKKNYSQDIFLEKILNFLENNKDNNFFLLHTTQLPHGPVAINKVHDELKNNNRLTEIEKEYASMVKLLDDNVGVIIKKLKELNLFDKTIIVFAADNGHEIYYSQKGRCEKPYKNLTTNQLYDDYYDKYYSSTSGDIFNGNASLAGLKRSNLDGGVKIPLTFFYQNKIKKSKTSELVSMYDFLPTMADLLNVDIQKKDGISILPLIFNKSKLAQDRYVVFNSNYGKAIVENSGWKLRYYNGLNKYELFNIKDDYQEKNNLIEENQEKAFYLKSILDKTDK